jgi:hypothetical protein
VDGRLPGRASRASTRRVVSRQMDVARPDGRADRGVCSSVVAVAVAAREGLAADIS